MENLKQSIKTMVCCTILDFSLITKRKKYFWRSVIFSWQTVSLQKQHFPTIVIDKRANGPNSRNTPHLQNLK